MVGDQVRVAVEDAIERIYQAVSDAACRGVETLRVELAGCLQFLEPDHAGKKCWSRQLDCFPTSTDSSLDPSLRGFLKTWE